MEDNVPLNAIRSKHTKTILMSYLPIKRLFTLIKYSKQFQEMIGLSLSDYKHLNKQFNGNLKTNNITSKKMNIKLRLMLERTSLNYNTLNHHTLFNSSLHCINTILILKDSRYALGTIKGQILITIESDIKTYNEFDAHKAKITSMIQLENNNNLVSGSVDRDIKLWEISKMEVIHIYELNKPIHSLLEFSPTVLIAGTNELVVLSTVDFDQYHTINQHLGTVYSLSKANQTDLIVASSKLKIFHLGNIKAVLYKNYMDFITVFQSKAFAIKAFLLLEGNRIASAEDEIITVWDIQAKDYLYKLKGHTKSILSMVLINNDSFASAGDDCMIIIWNINDFSKSKLIYTCLDISIIKIMYTKEEEEFIVCCSNEIIQFKLERAYEEPNAALFDFYTKEMKMKSMIKVNQSNLLKLVPNNNP